MFDRTTHNHESKVVAVTQVVEKTISPDKVVDMYDKTAREVLRSVRVNNNILDGIVTQSQHSADTYMKTIRTRFVLNGKEYQGSFEVESLDILQDDDMKQRLFNHFAEIVTRQLFVKAVKIVEKD